MILDAFLMTSKKKHLNTVDTCSYKIISGMKRSRSLGAVSRLGSLLAKTFFKVWLMCFWSIAEYISGLFSFVKTKSLPPKQTSTHTQTEKNKHLRVHPGESLDRDDMTYHSRVYQISFWQIRPVWGGTAWWWERLWLKIGQGGLRDVWAGGYHDRLYRNVCGCYRSDGECLCVTTTVLLIFLGIDRRVMHLKDHRELYTAKNGNCAKSLFLTPVLFILGVGNLW